MRFSHFAGSMFVLSVLGAVLSAAIGDDASLTRSLLAAVMFVLSSIVSYATPDAELTYWSVRT